MKFEEVLPALREGRKIRRKACSWINFFGFLFISNDKLLSDNSDNDKYLINGADLLADDWEIVEKKKVKLRDLTEEQCCKWVKMNCEKLLGENCEGCPFNKVVCTRHVELWWFYHQDIFNDKFLDQEIEVEE